MSLGLGLVVVDHSYLSNQVDNLQPTIISFNDSHYPFDIVNPNAVGPVDVEAYITMAILYFFLMECLQFFLDFRHELLIYLLVQLQTSQVLLFWLLFGECLDTDLSLQDGGVVSLWTCENLLKEDGDDGGLFGPFQDFANVDLYLTVEKLSPHKLLNPDFVQL